MLCIVYQLCSRFFFYSPMNMCASSRWCGTHKLKKVVYVYSKCQTTTSFNSYFAISSTFERLGGSFAKIAQSHFFECISCRSLFLARNVADIYLYIADIYIFHWLSTWECFRREDEQIISVLIFSAIISAYVQLFCNSDSIVFFFVYVAHKNLVLMMLGQMLLKSQVSFWRTRIWCQCSVLVRLFNKTKASRKKRHKKVEAKFICII